MVTTQLHAAATPALRTQRRQRLDLPGVKWIPAPARALLRREVLAVLRHDGPTPDYDFPKGDPGLFGPDSVTWKIHADFPAMMAGGLAALVLQSLHPLALAGVWDHSDFRRHTLKRLRNTIAFIARTTYAPRAAAEAAIARVRRIHAAVVGVAPDGRAYRADDPHLLAWVHAAECWCFLRAYALYCHGPLPRALQDRYVAEMARVTEGLGGRDLPRSLAELDAFIEAVRSELACDARTLEVLRVLHAVRLPLPFADLGRELFFGAGAAVLPDWALQLLHHSFMDRARDRVAAHALRFVAPSIRAAMAEGGLAWRACRRTGADYAALFRWPAA